MLKHVHNVYPHYVASADGQKHTLYLLVQGWSEGKFCVLKHEPEGAPSAPNGWKWKKGPPEE